MYIYVGTRKFNPAPYHLNSICSKDFSMAISMVLVYSSFF
jgi:hypothetical protein